MIHYEDDFIDDCISIENINDIIEISVEGDQDKDVDESDID